MEFDSCGSKKLGLGLNVLDVFSSTLKYRKTACLLHVQSEHFTSVLNSRTWQDEKRAIQCEVIVDHFGVFMFWTPCSVRGFGVLFWSINAGSVLILVQAGSIPGPAQLSGGPASFWCGSLTLSLPDWCGECGEGRVRSSLHGPLYKAPHCVTIIATQDKFHSLISASSISR